MCLLFPAKNAVFLSNFHIFSRIDEALAEHLAGFRDHHECVGVHLMGGVAHLICLRLGAGAQQHLAVDFGIIGSPGADGGGASGAGFVDFESDLLTFGGDDDRQLARIGTVHDLVDDRGSDESSDQTVEDRIDIAVNRPAQRDDHQIDGHGHKTDGKMGLERLDGHGQKIRAACGGAANVKQRQTASQKDAGKQCGEDRISRIGGRERKDHIQKYRGDQNGADGFCQKAPAHDPVTQQDTGNVQQDAGDTDGKPEKIVDQQGHAGDPAGRKARVLGKGINAGGVQDASHDVARQIQQNTFPAGFWRDELFEFMKNYFCHI